MLSKSSASATPEVLDDFYRELEGFSLAPLWRVEETAPVSEPTSKAVPHLWRWKDLDPKARRAGDLIGTQDAERRVLMLLNPGITDQIATTNSLFSGLQSSCPTRRSKPTGTSTGPSTTWCGGRGTRWSTARRWNRNPRTCSACPARPITST